MNNLPNNKTIEQRLKNLADPVFPLSSHQISRPWRPNADASQRQAAVALLRVPLTCTGLTDVPASQDTHGILLIKRSDKLRGHSGQWALPGGKQDTGESLWQTAQRELHEEVGILGSKVHWLGDLGALNTGTGYQARVFAGSLLSPMPIQPDGSEAVAASVYPESWLFRSDTVAFSEVGVVPGRHFCWSQPGGGLPWPTPLWGATAFMFLRIRTLLFPELAVPETAPRMG